MNKIRLVSILALTLSLFTTLAVYAETPEEKGLRLAQEFDARDTGFGDSTAEMEMTLRNRAGDESTRQIRNRTLEIQGDGDKSMSLFDDPADVKGTASLTFSHGLEPDDQWLYLPALKRVKRISSKNKSGPFMGSEFAFEDIGSQEVEKYSYTFLREETCPDHDDWTCYVSERIPAYEYSGYSKQIVWFDKEHYRMIKSEFYDRKGDLLKILKWSDYNEYLGRYWRAGKMQMENQQNGKSTTLLWTNYKFGNGLSDADFNKNALKRMF